MTDPQCALGTNQQLNELVAGYILDVTLPPSRMTRRRRGPPSARSRSPWLRRTSGTAALRLIGRHIAADGGLVAWAGSGGENSPIFSTALCRSPVTTPGCTTATPSAGSISRMRFIRASDSAIPPPSGAAPPERLLPAPRGCTNNPSREATRRIAATSSVHSGVSATSGTSCGNVASNEYATRWAGPLHAPAPAPESS